MTTRTETKNLNADDSLSSLDGACVLCMYRWVRPECKLNWIRHDKKKTSRFSFEAFPKSKYALPLNTELHMRATYIKSNFTCLWKWIKNIFFSTETIKISKPLIWMCGMFCACQLDDTFLGQFRRFFCQSNHIFCCSLCALIIRRSHSHLNSLETAKAIQLYAIQLARALNFVHSVNAIHHLQLFTPWLLCVVDLVVCCFQFVTR